METRIDQIDEDNFASLNPFYVGNIASITALQNIIRIPGEFPTLISDENLFYRYLIGAVVKPSALDYTGQSYNTETEERINYGNGRATKEYEILTNALKNLKSQDILSPDPLRDDPLIPVYIECEAIFILNPKQEGVDVYAALRYIKNKIRSNLGGARDYLFLMPLSDAEQLVKKQTEETKEKQLNYNYYDLIKLKFPDVLVKLKLSADKSKHIIDFILDFDSSINYVELYNDISSIYNKRSDISLSYFYQMLCACENIEAADAVIKLYKKLEKGLPGYNKYIVENEHYAFKMNVRSKLNLINAKPVGFKVTVDFVNKLEKEFERTIVDDESVRVANKYTDKEFLTALNAMQAYLDTKQDEGSTITLFKSETLDGKKEIFSKFICDLKKVLKENQPENISNVLTEAENDIKKHFPSSKNFAFHMNNVAHKLNSLFESGAGIKNHICITLFTLNRSDIRMFQDDKELYFKALKECLAEILKSLPKDSGKHKKLSHQLSCLTNNIDTLTLSNIKAKIKYVRKIAAEHRDTGFAYIYKANFIRDTESLKKFNEHFDDEGNARKAFMKISESVNSTTITEAPKTSNSPQ